MGGTSSRKVIPYESCLNVKTGFINSNFANAYPPVPASLNQAVIQIFETAKSDKKFTKCKNLKRLKDTIHDIGDSTMVQFNGVNFEVLSYKKGTCCSTYFVTIKLKPAGNYQNFNHVRIIQNSQFVPMQQQYQQQQQQQQQQYNTNTQHPLQVPLLSAASRQQPQTQPYSMVQPVSLFISPQSNKLRPKASPKKLKKCTLIINLSGYNIFVKISRERYQIKKLQFEHEAKVNVEFKEIKSGIEGKRTRVEERQYNKFIQEGFENVSHNSYCQGPECRKKQPVYITVLSSINNGCIIDNKELDAFDSMYVNNNNSVTVISSSNAVKYLQKNKII